VWRGVAWRWKTIIIGNNNKNNNTITRRRGCHTVHPSILISSSSNIISISMRADHINGLPRSRNTNRMPLHHHTTAPPPMCCAIRGRGRGATGRGVVGHISGEVQSSRTATTNNNKTHSSRWWWLSWRNITLSYSGDTHVPPLLL